MSAAARALLDAEDELVDVGEHRLKDFPAPERLWLLVHDDRGPGDFPPLRTEPVRPTNLPADPRRLIGREAELESLWDMLTGRERLVTILGLGGTGKTRLALAAAEGLLSAFEGGVWLVPLAGVRDPVALIPAIAAALEVGDAEAGGRARRSRGGCAPVRRCSCSTTSSSSSTPRRRSRRCSSRRPDAACW